MGRIIWPNIEHSASCSEPVKRENYFKVIIEYSGPGELNSKRQSCPSTSHEDIQGGSKSLAPLMFNLDAGRRRCGQFHTPRPPYLGVKNLVPIELEAGWAPELVWTFWK